MRSDLTQLFAVRLIAPGVSFVGNLFLLRYFGAERFAVLATLLQGSLLACVVLKRGQDDAILYAAVVGANARRIRALTADLAIAGLLVASPWVGHDARIPAPAQFVAQILGLGHLVARINVESMWLQSAGRVWIGNLISSIITPVAAVATYSVARDVLPTEANSPQHCFVVSLAAGYFVAIATCAALPRTVATTTKLERQARQHSLWLFQIIDVTLLSGDLIILGILNARAGLEGYIAASRLAVASSFVMLALEQVLATAASRGLDTKRIRRLVPLCMLAIIPAYAGGLYVLGVRPGAHYTVSVLAILMTASTMHWWFLSRKVQWAFASESAPPMTLSRLRIITAASLLLTLFISVTLVHLEAPDALRAATVVALAVSIRIAMVRAFGRGAESQ